MMKRVPGAALLLCTIPFVLAAAERPPLLWADFKEPLQSHLGAPVQPIAVSERSGDAVVGSVRVVDSVVRVEGSLSQANASQWATLGIEVGGEPRGLPVDLTAYETIRIRLASSTPRVLPGRFSRLNADASRSRTPRPSGDSRSGLNLVAFPAGGAAAGAAF